MLSIQGAYELFLVLKSLLLQPRLVGMNFQYQNEFCNHNVVAPNICIQASWGINIVGC